MRLTLKITVAILLGIVLLFSIHSYLSIQREREQLKERLSGEARHLGQSLRVMTTQIWNHSGEDAAIGFLGTANLIGAPFKVRWVWLDGPPVPRYRPQVPNEKLGPLRKGRNNFV